MTVYVRNTSGSRFDADEKKISLYLFYNQQMHVTPETQCGGGPDSDWNDVPVLDTTLYGWEKGLRSLNKQKLPFVIKAKVFSATEFMKRTEQEFFAEAIIGAVGIGLSSSMYRSETAQAIATHSGIQDLQEGRQQHRSLMKELTTGLFQRHTIWPNSSYMGQVKAKITNSIKIRAGSTQRKNLPSPEYYQICAKFGGQDHTFVFTEEIEEEQ